MKVDHYLIYHNWKVRTQSLTPISLVAGKKFKTKVRIKEKQLTYTVFKTKIHVVIDNAQRPFGVLLLLVIRVHLTHKWNTVVLIKFLKVLRFRIFTLLLKLTSNNTDLEATKLSSVGNP